MSHLPENFSRAADDAGRLAAIAQNRAQEALRASRDYTRENPVPIVLGALLIGVVVGVLCGRREPKPKEASQIARDLVEETLSRMAERLPAWKRRDARPDSIRDGLTSIGRKIGWR
jgi:hypothetical protein